MVRPKKKSNRLNLQGQKWFVNTLTTMVTSLELDPCSTMTTSEDLDFPNDVNSSGEEPVTGAETTTPSSTSTNVTETDEESDSEEGLGNGATTVAEQVQMHFGMNNSGVHDNDPHQHKENPTDESTVNLSPVDCATLDVLKLCHDAGVSLEFYNILFALL